MRTSTRLLGVAAAAFLAFFAGRLMAPVVLPYKEYLSASPTVFDRVWIQVQSLGRASTYIAPNSVDSYIGLLVIFSVVYGLFRLRHVYVSLLYYFILGTYYAVMLDGGKAASAHAAFDSMMETSLAFLTRMPFYLVLPLTLMLGLPLVIAYVLSRLTERHDRQPN